MSAGCKQNQAGAVLKIMVPLRPVYRTGPVFHAFSLNTPGGTLRVNSNSGGPFYRDLTIKI